VGGSPGRTRMGSELLVGGGEAGRRRGRSSCMVLRTRGFCCAARMRMLLSVWSRPVRGSRRDALGAEEVGHVRETAGRR
jgi:hypothetical protein